MSQNFTPRYKVKFDLLKGNYTDSQNVEVRNAALPTISTQTLIYFYSPQRLWFSSSNMSVVTSEIMSPLSGEEGTAT